MTKTRFIICERCGAKIRDQGFNENSPAYASMLHDETCWSCAYWKGVVSDKSMNLVIVDGTCYDFKPWVSPPYPPNATMGMNGRKFFILSLDGKIHRSNDAWLIGKVPWNFRRELPDNAVEITMTAYAKLRNRRVYCCDKGCLDRYSCLFYDMNIEDKAEPFNSIPHDWVSGKEYCSSFLGVEELKKFTPPIDSKQFHNIIKLISV